MRAATALLSGVLAVLALASANAEAQEAIFTPAATSPAKGRVALRTQFRYARFENDPTGAGREGDVFSAWTRLSYGITGTLALDVETALSARIAQRSGGADDDARGLHDTRLSLKWRAWQAHSGAINTTRVALIGGVELPTGTGDLSSHSVDAFAGAVLTLVRGRHGFNQSVIYQLNTGTIQTPFAPNSGADDALLYDSAYLFRISPASFGSGDEHAWYATLELNGVSETGGDHEILISPGVLYEARRFAVEAAIRLPVYQQLNNRPQREVGLAIGIRWLF